MAERLRELTDDEKRLCVQAPLAAEEWYTADERWGYKDVL